MTDAAVWTIALLSTLAVTLLSGYPVAICLAGSALLISGVAAIFGGFDVSLLMALPNRIFAAMTNPVLVSVPLFIFMGFVLEQSKIAEDLLEDVATLLGNRPGGTAAGVCLVGGLLAASTGIVGATVVTMGVLALPAMLRRGYDPAVASGTVCAAGTLGQIIPPSIVLILLGDQLSGAWQTAQYERGNFAPDAVSINDLFAGALIPGLLLVSLYVGYISVLARFRPTLVPAASDSKTPAPRPLTLFRSLLPPVLLIIAVLGSILAGIASPTEAASIGAVGSVLLADYRLHANKGRRFGSSSLCAAICAALALIIAAVFDVKVAVQQPDITDSIALSVVALLTMFIAIALGLAFARLYQTQTSAPSAQSLLPKRRSQTMFEPKPMEHGSVNGAAPMMAMILQRTVATTSMIFLILIGATVFSLVFRGLGGDELIRDFVQSLPGGLPFAILTVMLVMFVLGFFLDFLEIIFIVVPVVAPVLLGMELTPGVTLSPVWLGVMIAINLQTSFLTPPFGFALFYLRGVVDQQVSTGAIYRGVIPFIILQLFMLIVLWFYPAMATWLPNLLYG